MHLQLTVENECKYISDNTGKQYIMYLLSKQMELVIFFVSLF